jgi:hypothetical protein
MSGSYTAFEVEAARRQELVENALREAADRRALDEANRGAHETREHSLGRGLAEVAASLVNRVGQRA